MFYQRFKTEYSIEIAVGPIGLSRRSSKDLLLPNWDNAAVRERLKERLEK